MLFSTCLIAACSKSDNTKLSAEKSLELSKKCSDQSIIAFKQLGFKVGTTDFYENHYNNKLNKCFILIQSPIATASANKQLIDAFELKSYAYWEVRFDNKKLENAFQVCEITIPNEPKKLCKSADDFDKFVSAYMNE
ncbi:MULTISPECIES: hypothetical protein [Polynucleobacter]|jgi:hypothetical protein|nr:MULTISPECIES: hypothetical protein [Polynucleobacter]MBU3562836.1 hypothetical protein [Polynucleobacter sp. Tro8-14-1]MDH6512528.1 hypothetical protein [Polynucleobacter sphagniphilus]